MIIIKMYKKYDNINHNQTKQNKTMYTRKHPTVPKQSHTVLLSLCDRYFLRTRQPNQQWDKTKKSTKKSKNKSVNNIKG